VLLYYLAVAVLVVALGAWILRPKRAVEREPWEPEDKIEPVDREELEAAEREVRDE
jgi:hypothetical protein